MEVLSSACCSRVRRGFGSCTPIARLWPLPLPPLPLPLPWMLPTRPVLPIITGSPSSCRRRPEVAEPLPPVGAGSGRASSGTGGRGGSGAAGGAACCAVGSAGAVAHSSCRVARLMAELAP